MVKILKSKAIVKPKKGIEETQLRAILRMRPSLKDTAAFFECSEDTIDRACKKYGNCTFAEFRDQNMVHTRFSIIRKAIGKAEAGDNTMLIFCLKNLCGWVDRFDNSHTVQTEKMSEDDIKKIILHKAKQIQGEKE